MNKKLRTILRIAWCSLEGMIKGITMLGFIFFFVVMFIRFDDSHWGYYIPGLDFVVMPGNEAGTEYMFNTCAHEIGHHIYYNEMTEEERELWRNISRNSTDFEYASEYARTAEHEDFAVSFETTIDCDYDSNFLRLIDKDKADFIDDHKGFFWIR